MSIRPWTFGPAFPKLVPSKYFGSHLPSSLTSTAGEHQVREGRIEPFFKRLGKVMLARIQKRGIRSFVIRSFVSCFS